MKNKKEAILRMVADAIMLNGSTLVGLLASYGLQAASQKAVLDFSNFMGSNIPLFLLVNAVCLPVFYLFGFYTRGRAYQGRYKALVTLQAVLLGFLIVGFTCFLFPDTFQIPRVGLVIAALVSVFMLVGARFWMAAWTGFNSVEPSLRGSHYDVVHKPRNVVVIGGAGYIGSGLLRKLLDRGYRVRLVDSFMFGEEPIQDMIGHRNLEIVKADFRQIDKIVSALHGMDAVIHIGAIVGDPACALDEDFTIEVNLMATRMIAECAKGFGIKKFIFASTCSVYGASDEILNEKSALNPVSLYARSKIACEKILIQMSDENFKPTILRFGTVYGLSGRTRFDLVVNLLTAKAIVDGKITVFGEDQWRPFVHVDDASLAVATALDSPMELVGGQTFNVGADAGNMTLGEVGRMIQRFVPTAELIASGSDGDRRNYRVDFSKIKNMLGYKPQWSVEQGVRQVIEAFETGKVTDYTATQYSNVKFLTEEAELHGLKVDSHRMRALVEETAFDQAVVQG